MASPEPLGTSRTLSARLVVVFVVMTHPRLRIGQSCFITPFRDYIQVVVGPIEHVQSASVAGIGVENTSLRILIKNAEASAFLPRELTHLVVVVHLPFLQLFWREGHVIIPVKIAATR